MSGGPRTSDGLPCHTGTCTGLGALPGVISLLTAQNPRRLLMSASLPAGVSLSLFSLQTIPSSGRQGARIKGTRTKPKGVGSRVGGAAGGAGGTQTTVLEEQ